MVQGGDKSIHWSNGLAFQRNVLVKGVCQLPRYLLTKRTGTDWFLVAKESRSRVKVKGSRCGLFKNYRVLVVIETEHRCPREWRRGEGKGKIRAWLRNLKIIF